MDLNFKVENQELIFDDAPKHIVAKSKHYLKCFFEFLTDDWDDIAKIAVFYNDKGQEYLRYIDLNDDGKYYCEVPYNALKGDYFKLCVYGGDLIITQLVTIPLVRTGYQRQHHCADNTDIFVDIFELINRNNENAIKQLDVLEETKFDKDCFNDSFDARMELWVCEFIDAINTL